MRGAAAVMVGPADIRVRRGSGLLTCVGLRSGACLALYDPQSKIAGMAHVIQPWANPGDTAIRPGKAADTVVGALVDAMERTGAERRHLLAGIAAGSAVPEIDPVLIDTSVAIALRNELRDFGISVLGEDHGQAMDRGVLMDIAQGAFRVRMMEGDRLVCDFTCVQRTNFTGRFTPVASPSADREYLRAQPDVQLFPDAPVLASERRVA